MLLLLHHISQSAGLYRYWHTRHNLWNGKHTTLFDCDRKQKASVVPGIQNNVTSFLAFPFRQRRQAQPTGPSIISPNLALQPHTTNFISSCHFRDSIEHQLSVVHTISPTLSNLNLSTHSQWRVRLYPAAQGFASDLCRGVTLGMKTRINAYDCYRRSCCPRHRQWVSEDILSYQWIMWIATRAVSQNRACAWPPSSCSYL